MSAIKYFKKLTPFIQAKKKNCMSSIFRLHCDYTTGLLIGSSLLLGASEYMGQPINCMSTLPKNLINNYCWVSKTFTIHDYSNRETGQQAAAPGVFTPESYDDDHIQEKWRFHNYYQWVVFFLLMMAFCCAFPKRLWKLWEGGLMKTIQQNLTKSAMYKENDIASKKAVIIDYMFQHIKLHDHYVYKYFFCELLCFINIIVQLFTIDKFLGGEFFTYGLKVLDFSEMDQVERVDPMIFVFPRMTKCTFHMFGASGTIERKDSFCLLTQNILNEKIFIVVWLWYIILCIQFSFLLIYRLFLILSPALRIRILYNHTRIVPMETLQAIGKRCSIGDWWIFYQLSRNVNSHIYKDVISQIARKLETKASNEDEYSNQHSNGYVGNGAAHGSKSNGKDGVTMYPYFPNGNGNASAPPSGFVQSAV